MRLSEHAEKILLLAYKNQKGEKYEISSNALRISPDLFDKAWNELEGNNDSETVYVNGNIRESGTVDELCKHATNVRIYDAGIEYVKKFLESSC